MELHGIASIFVYWVALVARAAAGVTWWAGVRWKVRKRAQADRAEIRRLNVLLQRAAEKRTELERALLQAESERKVALEFWMSESGHYRDQIDRIIQWGTRQVTGAGVGDPLSMVPPKPDWTKGFPSRLKGRELAHLITNHTMTSFEETNNDANA